MRKVECDNEVRKIFQVNKPNENCVVWVEDKFQSFPTLLFVFLVTVSTEQQKEEARNGSECCVGKEQRNSVR